MSAGGIRAGRAFVEIGANDRELQQTILRVRARLQSLAGSLTAIGGGLIGAGTGILGAMAWPLKLAADMEFAESQFATLLGSMDEAKGLLAELSEFAASTPFEFPDLAEAGRILLSYGSTSAGVIRELKQLGEVAAATGAPINELAGLFGKMRQNGRLMGDDLNQLGDRAIPMIEGLAEHFGIAEEEVRDFVSKGKVSFNDFVVVLNKATSAGGRFAGGMENASKTLIGRWSTLKDNIAAALRPLGQALLPIVGTIVTQLTTAAQVIGAFIEKNRDMAVIVAAVGGGLIILGGVLASAGVTMFAVAGLIATVASALTVLSGVLSSVAGAFVAIVTNPWAIGIAAVVAAIVGLLGYFGKLEPMWQSMKSSAASAFTTIQNSLFELGSVMLQTWRGVSDAVAAGDMEAAFAIVTSGIELVWARTLGAMNQAWSDWITPFRDAWTDAATYVAQLGGVAFYGVQAVWAEVTGNMAAAADSFVTGVVNAVQYLIGFFDRLNNIMAQVLEKVVSYVPGSANFANKGAANANIQQLEEEYQLRARNRQQAIDSNRDSSRGANQARRAGTDQRLGQIGQNANDYFSQLQQMAAEEKRSRANVDQAAQSAAAQRMVAARAELDRLTKEAEARRAAMEADRDKKLGEAGQAARQATDRRTESFGTFNISTAAQQFGFGSTGTDRIAKATEATAKETQRIADRMDSAQMVFA